MLIFNGVGGVGANVVGNEVAVMRRGGGLTNVVLHDILEP